MMDVTIWHNPRCSKSRQTLALLEEKGVKPEIRLYLTDRPSVDEIKSALFAAGLPAIELVRTGEKIFKELGLSKDDPDEVLITAMAANPILIERPLVLTGGKAALGRPPEAVLDLIG